VLTINANPHTQGPVLTKRSNIMSSIETYLEGVQYPCDLCANFISVRSDQTTA